MTRDLQFAGLELDAERTVDEICRRLRAVLRTELKRRGLVVAISGGIDSSVTAALAARAVGPERVFGLLMPERDSSPETLPLSRCLAESIGIDYAIEDITAALDGVRCYQRYDDAVRRAVPEYGPGWKSKIVLSPALGRVGYPLYSVVARSPSGETVTAQLRLHAYLEIVAATNFKQRTRKMLEYYHADRLNYAVAGTPNRLEYDQGFFVKGGDGLADVKPIAHLYKTQVYQLAEHLGVPERIRSQPPSTDTYSLEQTQGEFYFGLPHDKMDMCLYGLNHHASAETVARRVGLEPEQVERVFQDIRRKRAATRPLHVHSLLVSNVPQIHE
jgi:NAD+ synthase